MKKILDKIIFFFSITHNLKISLNLEIDSEKVVINMGEEFISQEFRLKNIEEIRNYFTKKIDQNKLMMGNKYNKVCTTLNYIEQLLILAPAVTGYISIFVFAFLFGILIGIGL